MTPAEYRLRVLATERFQTLTSAEELLLRQGVHGEEAHYESLDDAKNDLQQADTWGPERTIHAEVVRWLCVDHDAIRYIDPKGLSIHGARIDGGLDLSMVPIPFPLFLVRCALRGSLNLEFAEVRLLEIIGSTTQAIHGHGMVVHGDLRLLDGFDARGPVELFSATIDGNLDCTGGQFHHKDEGALLADLAKIGGTVFLSEKFQAEGEVRLVGATINGDLNCIGGQFHHKGRTALSASGAKINGNVFLRNKFQGEVDLTGATITGHLDCEGGVFHHAVSTALSASGAKIGGGVFLRNKFQAEGEVDLTGTHIQLHLDCRGACFKGLVRCSGAQIQGHLDCQGASFSGDARNGLIGESMLWAGPLIGGR
jgi:hypothetical protein